MSQIGQYKCSLGKVNEKILEKALNYLARKMNGLVAGAKIRNYGGNELSEWQGKKILAAISTDAVPRGIGVAFDNGRIVLVGDGYGHNQAFNELRGVLEKKIQFVYKQMAVIIGMMARKNAKLVEHEDLGNGRTRIRIEVD